MKKQMRKYGAGAAVLGAVAGAAALALPAEPTREPVARGDSASARQSVWGAGVAARETGAARGNVGGAWRPITRNLTANPDQLLPTTVSAARPVRVVSTSRDRDGRLTVTARTATDRNGAAALVTAAQQAPGAIGVELDAPVSVAATDSLRHLQWDLDRIRTDEAWQRATGTGITVAVVDSGVNAAHPDLAGQVLPGADFITGLEGTAIDPHGHGTHVAGTIAALAGNGAGIAGLAPDARILPVRVIGDNGSGYMSDVANGIAYAADHGAHVINLSVSGTVQVGAVSNAVAYARSKGVVVVAAAGNARRSGSPTSYPAADEGVLAVAATDSADNVAGYSTQGGYVDVAAPGSDIVSTYRGDSYGRMSGTSMAAPHVAALAALLKAHSPGLAPDAVEQAIIDGAVDLGAPGRDVDFGAGRIDATAALTAVTPAPATTEPATGPDPAGDPTPEPVQTPSQEPTPSPTQESTPNPTQDPTNGPTQDPSNEPTREPSNEPTREPSNSPPTAPTTGPPAPTATPTPAPTSSAPSRPDVLAYLVKTGPAQLTIAIRDADGQTVEVQRQSGNGWETFHTYRATLVVRLNDLPTGRPYRVVVPDSDRYTGVTTATVRL